MNTSIKRDVSTRYKADELRSVIETKFLARKELQALLSATEWKGNTLFVESKLLSGVITISDYEISLDIQLTLFGSAAKTKIADTIDAGLKMLAAPDDSNKK